MRSAGTGLVLLEVMVALVILGLVAVGYLELLHASHALVARSREQAEAVAYAAAGMEHTKLELASLGGEQPTELLPGGFRREVAKHRWRPGLVLLNVTVYFPYGGRFDLTRLADDGLEPRSNGAANAPRRDEP